MLEFTDWAKDILRRADEAARRLNPDARVRLASAPQGLEAVLADGPQPDDQEVALDGAVIYVQQGLAGLIDIEEPHDRIVLRERGAAPNRRPDKA